MKVETLLFHPDAWNNGLNYHYLVRGVVNLNLLRPFIASFTRYFQVNHKFNNQLYFNVKIVFEGKNALEMEIIMIK